MTDSSTEVYCVPEDEPPPQIPDLRLLRRIGRGAFGEVWLAQNVNVGGFCAVKILRAESGDSTTRIDPSKALVYEQRGLSKLAEVAAQHPNLVTIHHVGRTEEYLYYTMDVADDVDGRPLGDIAAYQPASLARRLNREVLSREDCIRFSRELLQALAFLHENGMVHRDVKPGNCILIQGSLKLADFGLLTDVDRTSSLVGTRMYMPPDFVMDARADVYAAGLVIYEMLSGLPAKRCPELGSRTVAIANDPVLAAVNRVAIRACEPQRDRRFPDAVSMLKAFEKHVDQESGKVAVRRLRKIGAAVLAALIVLLGATGLFLSQQTSNGPMKSPVEVNFISDPPDAEILLDGEIQLGEDGTPLMTPCTIPRLPQREHHVVFRHSHTGQEYDLGSIDFAKHREVELPGR